MDSEKDKYEDILKSEDQLEGQIEGQRDGQIEGHYT